MFLTISHSFELISQEVLYRKALWRKKAHQNVFIAYVAVNTSNSKSSYCNEKIHSMQ